MSLVLKRYLKITMGLFSIVLMFALTANFTLMSHSTEAAPVVGFVPGEIIDNPVFTNYTSMTASQIQAFLNSKVTNCDTQGTQPATEYGRPDLTHAQYAAAQNPAWPGPPYACLKDYSVGGVSAAQIIYNIAQQYEINPQVLIVLLQKEQALVTDTWPLSWQYQSATGYGCPDTSGCDTNYYGLVPQLTWAATLYHTVVTGNQNWSNPYGSGTVWYSPFTLGSNNIYYNPIASCGFSSVNIVNSATQALYDYTGYQPNSYALNGGTSSAYPQCGAFGNLNFYNYFTNWFGSTKFPQPVGASLYRKSSDGSIYLVINQTAYYIPSPAILNNYGLNKYQTIPISDADFASFTSGGTLSNTISDDSGNIYLVDGQYKHYIPGPSVCTAWAIDCFNTGVVKDLGSEFTNSYLNSGSNLGTLLWDGSSYYNIDSGTKEPFANIASYTALGNTPSSAVTLGSINTSLPLGKLLITTPGVISFNPNYTIYYFSGTSYYAVGNMDIYKAWGLQSQPALSVPISSYNLADTPASTPLSYFAQDTSGNKYLINNGQKLLLTASQQLLWPGVTYVTGMDPLLNILPTGALGRFIYVGTSLIMLTDTGTKEYITSVPDYFSLGGNNSNTTVMGSGVANMIATGPYAFPDGTLLMVSGDPAIYVMNEGSLLHVASMGVLNAYGFNTSNIRTFSSTVLSGYNFSGVLSNGVLADGRITIPYNNSLYLLSPSIATSYGVISSGFTPISNALIAHSNTVTMTSLLRDDVSGAIYNASGGSLHHILSPSSLNNYRGIGVVPVNSYTLSLFTAGDPI